MALEEKCKDTFSTELQGLYLWVGFYFRCFLVVEINDMTHSVNARLFVNAQRAGE